MGGSAFDFDIWLIKVQHNKSLSRKEVPPPSLALYRADSCHDCSVVRIHPQLNLPLSEDSCYLSAILGV